MKEESSCDSALDNCNGRREFLVKTSAIAGGLVLSLAGLGSASAQEDSKKSGKMSKDSESEDLVLKLDDKSPLSKVGGSQTVETKSGKIVIARTSETAFVALSAKCPHKGGPIKYDEKTKQFFCPWHNSRFGTDGANAGGPANTPLQAYLSQSAIVVSIGKKGK